MYLHVFQGSKLVYKGKETQVVFDDLKPNTSYNYKLKVSAIGDDSPFSKVVTRVTGDFMLLFVIVSVIMTNCEKTNICSYYFNCD